MKKDRIFSIITNVSIFIILALGLQHLSLSHSNLQGNSRWETSSQYSRGIVSQNTPGSDQQMRDNYDPTAIDNRSTTGTNLAIPRPNWNTVVSVHPTASAAVCKLIPNVPDEHQPPASGRSNWCAPTAAVNIVDYWANVRGSVPGLQNNWARNVASDSLGWFMDTNNTGSPARSNSGISGTMTPDIGSGLVDFAEWGGSIFDTYPVPFAPNSNKTEWECDDSTEVVFGWCYYAAEIDSGYPVIACFNFWNPIYSGIAVYDSVLGDTLHFYEWGDSTGGSTDPEETWDPLQDVGHAVTGVGYCRNYDPDDGGPLPLTNWAIVHDNWPGTEKHVVIPWGHWMATVSVRFSPLLIVDPSICHWPRYDEWWIGDHIWQGEDGLYCQVNNRGTVPTESAVVNFYYTDPTASQYFFDPDLRFIGSAPVPTLAPGDSVEIGPVAWTPPYSNGFGQPYWTIVAAVESPEDPVDNGWPEDDNNVAGKSHWDVSVESDPAPTLHFLAKNPEDTPAEAVLIVDRSQLPEEWEVTMDPPEGTSIPLDPHASAPVRVTVTLGGRCTLGGVLHVREHISYGGGSERTTGGVAFRFHLDEPGLSEIQSAISDSGWTDSWTAGTNPTANLSSSQKCELCGLLFPPEDEGGQFKPQWTEDLPTTWDWRNVRGTNYVSPIKDQGQCGSCWAFAGVAALESMLKISGSTSGVLDLSEQFMVSCSDSNYGCDGGYPDETADFLKTTGTPDEPCFRYCACDTPCNNRCTDWGSRVKRVRGWSYQAQQVPVSVTALKSALLKGPLFTTMRVFFDFYFYKSGIYRHTLGPWVGNHAIALVGYDDNKKCFIAKNSWNTTWGESGYFRIAYSQCHNRVRFGQYSIAFSMGTPDPEICHWPRPVRYWMGSHIILGAGELRASIKNIGEAVATNVLVNFYYQTPCAVAHVPDDFLQHIGSETVDVLVPGDSVLVGPLPFAPPGMNTFGQPHWSYLVTVESDDDSITTGWPEDDNNVACQNFWTVRGDSGVSEEIHFYLKNHLETPTEFEI
ncbi:MAG: hypothetical protein JSV84_03415, partial [Gemmatimonadota bacterium]